jgi:hypothetical protein
MREAFSMWRFARWRASDPIPESDGSSFIKYEVGILYSGKRKMRRLHRYRPKRFGADVERVYKRRKLDGEGRWEYKDGFDKHGVYDEDYEKLLESLKGLRM